MQDPTTTLRELRDTVAKFVADRDWQRYHDAKNLSMALAIEAAELMEHFQWTRTEELPALVADARVRAEVADELADVACFLLALVNALDIDLAAAIEQKLRKNEAKYPVDEFRGRYYKPRSHPPDTDAGGA